MTKEVQIFKHEMFEEVDVAIALGYIDADDAIKRHCKHHAKHLISLNTGSMKLDGTYVYRN